MAEDLGRRDEGVEDLFDVGAADTAGGNFDEHFAFSNFGDGNFFDANDAFFAVNAGAHGFRDGVEGAGGFESCAGAAHRAATTPYADAATRPS